MQNIPEVHIKDYLHLIKRRKWIIIACLFITVTTVAIGNYAMEPIYQATVQLIVDREQRKSPVTGEMMEYESYESESLTFQTYFSLIDSFPVLKNVVERLPERQRQETEPAPLVVFKEAIIENIRNIKQFIRDLFPAEEKEARQPADDASLILHAQVNAIRSRIRVEPITDTRLVNVSVEDTDPVFARDIANAVAQSYIDYHMTSRLEAAKGSMAWLTEQLRDMKEKIKESERNFYGFKEREGIFSIEGKQRIDTQRIAEVNSYYGDAKSRRLELEATIHELRKILDHDTGERSPPTIIKTGVLQDLHSELVMSEIELSKLRKTYRWKHPMILEMNSKIQQIKDTFDAELKKTLKNLNSEHKVLTDRELSLLSTIRQYETEALTLNKKEMQYAILDREVETNKELHNLLLTKFKETNITENMNITNIRLVKPAVTPEIPIKPKKKLNLILAAIMGLMTGIGFAFFLEYLDRTIKTPEQVAQYLDLPILAAIPKVGK
ncbi:MAG: GumC family protein [Deltaproteobacteria bacterium]|nr:GumC family protein [Deltaproteobacteria bacterium]